MPAASISEEVVHEALKRWHEAAPQSPLASLLAVRSQRGSGVVPHGLVNQLLLNLLNRMEQQTPELGALLKARFVDGMQVFQVANRLNIGEATFFRRQKEAITQLTRLLADEESEARQVRRDRLGSRLEAPTYETLFGAEEHLERLQELLDTDSPPWLLLLTGIGGIGKTALTDALLRRMIPTSPFVDIAWTTARQQQIQLDGAILPVVAPALTPAALLENLAYQLLDEAQPSLISQERLTQLLTERLKEDPHLVVVDNLETVQDVIALASLLRQMATPSKFVLTSRKSIPAAAYLHHYPVPLLGLADSLALVRWEATSRNLPLLANARDEELRPIYETVGGNPLALRLVVGQSHHYSLPVVLEKLTAAQGATSEALYSHIYRWAWDALDDNGQGLFLSLPLLPENGADLAFLETISGLSSGPFHDALESLLRLNLLDHRSHSLRQSVYTIHSLTRSFLLQEVLRWPR